MWWFPSLQNRVVVQKAGVLRCYCVHNHKFFLGMGETGGQAGHSSIAWVRGKEVLQVLLRTTLAAPLTHRLRLWGSYDNVAGGAFRMMSTCPLLMLPPKLQEWVRGTAHMACCSNYNTEALLLPLCPLASLLSVHICFWLHGILVFKVKSC